MDMKVKDRESITVPAGQFSCFRVEGKGWRLGLSGLPSQSIESTYWIAPDKVARAVAIESWWRVRNKITRSDRDELVAFARAP